MRVAFVETLKSQLFGHLARGHLLRASCQGRHAIEKRAACNRVSPSCSLRSKKQGNIPNHPYDISLRPPYIPDITSRLSRASHCIRFAATIAPSTQPSLLLMPIRTCREAAVSLRFLCLGLMGSRVFIFVSILWLGVGSPVEEMVYTQCSSRARSQTAC